MLHELICVSAFISLTIIVGVEGYRQFEALVRNMFLNIYVSTTLYIFSVPTDIYIETDYNYGTEQKTIS